MLIRKKRKFIGKVLGFSVINRISTRLLHWIMILDDDLSLSDHQLMLCTL